MFRHNIILFLRNIKKYKGTFLINIAGLSTGLACALLITLWVTDERKIDKFHEKDSRLYQVMRYTTGNLNQIDTYESNSMLLVTALAEEMPEVEHIVPVRVSCDGVLSANDKNIKASGMLAGKDFFNLFSYPLIRGDKNQVLKGINNIVISDELATKLFGTIENIVNNTVLFDFDQETYDGVYNISGVYEKSGYRSSESFDFLLTTELFLAKKNPEHINWISNNVNVYLTLKEGLDVHGFNAKIKDFVRTKFQIENEPKGVDWLGKLFLRPYSERYLYSHFENGVQSGGRIEYVVLFSIIALFILVIACINFMNLSTAQASRKLKQIGVKKAMGSDRKTLILQYFGESLCMAFLSLLIAIVLVWSFLPQFNEITGKQLIIGLNTNLILSGFGLILFTGLIAGSYPALYLSGFNPVRVLKGQFKSSKGVLWARKGLVIFQFSVSIILIVAVLVLNSQVEFVQSKNLGYEKDNVVMFDRQGELNESLESFLSEAKNVPDIVNASAIRGSATNIIDWTGAYSIKGFSTNEAHPRMSNTRVGYDFMETLGIEMKEGRSFSEKFGDEGSKIILNERAVDMLGIDNPIGRIIRWGDEDKEIVGVTKNFHFQSLFEEVKPMVLLCDPESTNKVLVKIQAGTTHLSISKLEALYNSYNQGLPFDFKFLDEEYQALYAGEQRIATLSKYFAGLAIIISCLGLFGLATFTAERRRKEISIRKVLGQSASQVVAMLSSEFAKLVIVSILIALPVSYLLASNWLSGFAYHTPLQIWYFLGAGIVALLVAMMTVGSQAMRAANRNPIGALREE